MQSERAHSWRKPIAVGAAFFGFLTLFVAGSILLDLRGARAAAGAYVPFVVQFNFIAGLFYIIAAIGIWQKKHWAQVLSGLIAVATGAVALAFAWHVMQGGGYEMRTVGALALRAGLWGAIAFWLRMKKG